MRSLLLSNGCKIYSINRLVYELFHWLSTMRIVLFQCRRTSIVLSIGFLSPFHGKCSAARSLYRTHTYRIELLLHWIWEMENAQAIMADIAISAGECVNAGEQQKPTHQHTAHHIFALYTQMPLCLRVRTVTQSHCPYLYNQVLWIL